MSLIGHDCIAYLVRFITDGRIYKSLLFLDKTLHQMIIGMRDKYVDHLSSMLMSYPRARWGWYYIISHKHLAPEVIEKYWDELDIHAAILSDKVDINFIRKHKDDDIWSTELIKKYGKLLLPLVDAAPLKVHYAISAHTLTEEYVKANPSSRVITWSSLSANINISSDFIFATKHTYKWYWAYVSTRSDLTGEQIKSHISILDIGTLCAHGHPLHRYLKLSLLSDESISKIIRQPYITIEDVRILAHRLSSRQWTTLADRNNITFNNVLENPSLSWDMLRMMLAKNAPWQILKKLIPYNFNMVSVLGTMPLRQYVELCDDYHGLLDHVDTGNKKFIIEHCKQTTIATVRRYSACNLSLPSLFVEIPISDIAANMDLAWDWKAISDYISITDIINHPEISGKLIWSRATNSVNISFDDILDNPQYPWTNMFVDTTRMINLKWTKVTAGPEKYKTILSAPTR